MKSHKLCQVFAFVILLIAMNFFTSCSMGGNPSEEGYSGEISVVGTLSSAGPGPSPFYKSLPASSGDLLPGYQLYCVTTTAPIVEGRGIADDHGNVKVVMKVQSASFGCSVLDPVGAFVAPVIFTSASGKEHGETIMGSGTINLVIISVYFDEGVAQATVPSNIPIVDYSPPETTITSHPPDPDSLNFADFSFNCSKAPCTYECDLDGTGWESCPAPKHYSGLSNSTHNFSVRAIDRYGNVDLTPATYSWTVNAIPPDTSITSEPPDPSTSNSAGFQFTCSPLPCTFECNLDFGGWEACASPKTYSALSDDTHTFQVRAKNAVGNVDPDPPSYDWTVDANPPDTSITSQPPNPSHITDASFQFSCSPGPCTYECNLDSGTWSACASPKNYTGLSEGPHTFKVRAKDVVGNIDPTPPTYAWSILLHDYWISTSTTNAPAPREAQPAVWTGSEMFVWGGNGGGNTGGRYNPVTDSWIATSTTNAPEARNSHSAIWSGNLVIIWGGYNGISYLNTGGLYNPTTDSWTSTTITNAPSIRVGHTAVWTGTEMIIWGGVAAGFLNTGGRYNPATDSWTSTTTTNAPSIRATHTAVWTGTEMIVWGGYTGVPYCYNDGGRYNPATDSWTQTSTTNAPAIRTGHTAVWTDTEMIVWGGYNDISQFNSGGRYNPATDSWTTTTTTNAPSTRTGHIAVWTGTEMIVWGGYGTSYLNTGGRYNPATDSWAVTSITNTPEARDTTTAIWTGNEMIVWGGGPGYFNTGGRYIP